LLALVWLAGFGTQAFAQGSISGRVTGVDAPTGLPNTIIQVFDLNADDFGPTTTADASGNYTINLPAGNYAVLTNNLLGYINEIYNNVPCSAVCDVNLITPITVTNAAVTGINFVLDPGSRISGNITDSTTLLPIAGVTVYFVNADAEVFFTSALTDALGNYISNGGSTTGNVFALTANTLGYRNELYDNIHCVGCDPDDGTPIAVVLGTPKTGINFALERGGLITGNVTNSSDQPLADVNITVFDSSGEWVDEVATDASGNYVTGGLATGTYYVRAEAFGLVDELYDNRACAGGNCNPTDGTPISVTAPNPTSNINFVLSPGGTITGRVTAAAGGAPVEGAFVGFATANANLGGAFTNAAGDYSQMLPPGTVFAVVANVPGLANQLYNGLPCPAGPSGGWICNTSAGTPITITTGANTSNIDFAMPAAGSISGTVTNSAGGAPLSGIAVQVFSNTGVFLGNVFTDASGSYTFGSMTAGSYYVRTNTGSNFINQLYNGVTCVNCNVTSSGGTLVAVTANTTTPNINFSLSAGGLISGTITNASGGAPLQNIQAQIFNSAGVFVNGFNTNASGFYQTSGLPPGTYYVRTQSSLQFINELYNNLLCTVGCNVTTGTPVVVTGTATTPNINFALSAGGRISGTVTNAVTGAPIQGVNAQIFDATGANFSIGTNPQGFYQTSGLPPGTYYVRTQNTLGFLNELYNDLPCPITCTVTTGTPVVVTGTATTPNINFALAAGGRITGTVTNAVTGAPIQGVNAQIFDATGASFSVGTNAAGFYQTSGLPSGTYYVRTTNTLGFINELYNDLPCPVSCNVTTGTPVLVTGTATTPNINFALSAGGRITGTVTNVATGLPIQGVTAQIFDTTGAFFNAGTNALGFYQTSGLPPGTYYVRTSNNLGFINELYNDLPCSVTCTVTTGMPVIVTGTATTANINFALAAGGRISGTVTHAVTGAPIQGVGVEIYNSTSYVGTVGTNAQGFYQTSGLPAGTYYANTFNTLGYFNELYNNLPCNPWCDAKTGAPIVVAVAATTMGIDFALARPGGPADVTFDFGSAGLWTRYNHTTWAPLHTLSPGAMASGDIDRDGRTDLIATFPGYGVWAWMNNAAWARLHTLDASLIATGDMDGNGRDDVIMVFPGFGVWVWMNNSTFVPLHTSDPDRMVTGDLDGNGRAEVILNFPGIGIWVRVNNSTWQRMHTSNATAFTVGNFDGTGGADVIVNFPGLGLWVRNNNTSWTFLHASNATVMAAGDIDNSGRADAIISFSGAGIWAWMNGGSFKLIHSADAASITVADIDGGRTADVLISFPSYGVLTWMNDSFWTSLHLLNPQGMISGNLDGF
jgi:hypothetical protein